MTDFEQIYLAHFCPVCKYVFSLCGDTHLAEEITQEAFYKAMENLHRFDGKGSLYAWLCQIAKNTYFTHYKKQKRHAPEAEAVPSGEISLEEHFLDRETAQRLYQLLHRLEEPYKEVFTLRVFAQLPFSQIGQLFGKTDSWARLIYHRAKLSLRRDLNENEL